MLGPGDERVLEVLAADEPDFDLPGRSSPRQRLSGADAAAYLADPCVLHWVAEDEGAVVGFLLCYLERRRAGTPRQLLLYEIGVRESYRRQRVGTTLLDAMRHWMQEAAVTEVWVLADSRDAERFYTAYGFVREEEQAVQMLFSLARA